MLNRICHVNSSIYYFAYTDLTIAAEDPDMEIRLNQTQLDQRGSIIMLHHSTLRHIAAASLVVAEKKQPLVRSHSGVITGNPLTAFFISMSAWDGLRSRHERGSRV